MTHTADTDASSWPLYTASGVYLGVMYHESAAQWIEAASRALGPIVAALELALWERDVALGVLRDVDDERWWVTCRELGIPVEGPVDWHSRLPGEVERWLADQG